MSVETAMRCLGLLRERGETLATAESLTAGLISATFAATPGASDALLGGLAAYSTVVKTAVLGVDLELVETFGVVSAECAEAMAAQARLMFGSTWAVSATGVAGPDRQEGRPVGDVYVAVAGPADVQHADLSLVGSRQDIRAAAADAALSLLETALRQAGNLDPHVRTIR